MLENIKKVSIGDVTSETIEKSGLKVDMQSKIATIDSMIETIFDDIK